MDAYAVMVGVAPFQDSVFRPQLVLNISVCASNSMQASIKALAALCPCIGDCPTGTNCVSTGVLGVTTTPVDTGVLGSCPLVGGQTVWIVEVSTADAEGVSQCSCQ